MGNSEGKTEKCGRNSGNVKEDTLEEGKDKKEASYKPTRPKDCGAKIPEVWHGKPSKTAKSAKPENFRKGKGKRRKTARGFVSPWRGHWLQPARLRVGRPHVRREEGPQKRNAVRVISSDRTSDCICNARRQVGRACRTGQALEAQETVREEGTPNGLKPLRTVLLHSTTRYSCLVFRI